MTALVVRRLVWALLVTWLVVTLVFGLAFVVGDPATAALGEKASAEAIERFRVRHGLDRPLLVQYLDYVGGVPRGDLGQSFRDGRDVSSILATRLPRTLLLGGLALALELALGLGIGVLAALRRDRPTDTVAMSLSYLGTSTPTFLGGLLLLYWIGFRLGWLPVGGYGVDTLDHLRHAVLPATTLALFGAATYARLMRGELIDALAADHVRFARARGLPETRVVWGHGVRTALLPVVTVAGLQVGALASGAIVTEQVFAWPGMGRLAFEAVHSLDLPVILGVVVVASVAVQLGNLLADLAVAALDPRIRR